MNEKHAAQAGFRYTGISESDREPVKQRSDEIRKQGYKTMIITKPPNPLSRGGGRTYYSVYAEERYHKDEHAQTLRAGLARIEGRRQHAVAEYEKALAAIANDETEMLTWMKDNGYAA